MSAERTMPQRGTISRNRELPSLVGEIQPVRNRPEAPSFPKSPFDTLVSRAPSERPVHAEPRQPIVPSQQVEYVPSQTLPYIPPEQSSGSPSMPTRLEQIATEIQNSIIPIGFVDEQLHLYAHAKDLSVVDTSFIRPGLVAVDVAVVRHPDGSETRYVDRPEVVKTLGIQRKTAPGVYREEYVRDESGKLKLTERKKVGERVSVELITDPKDPQGEPREFYYILTEKTNKLALEKGELEKRAEIEDEYGVRLGNVSYIPTVSEAKSQAKQRENISKTLNLAKESLWERSKYSVEIFGASLLGSWFFWGVPVPAFINKGAVALGVSPYIYEAISRTNGGPSSLSKQRILQITGLAGFIELGTLLPLGLAAGLPVLPIAAGAAGLIGAGILAKRAIDFQRFKRKHSELKGSITYKKQWRDLYREEKGESIQNKSMAKLKQQHSQNFSELKKMNPNVPDEILLNVIGSLQEVNKLKLSQSVEAKYQQKIGAAQLKAAVPGMLLYAGLILGDHFLFHIPTIAGLAGTVVTGIAGSLGNSLIATTARHRNLMAIKQEVKQNNPELLSENGKNGSATKNTPQS